MKIKESEEEVAVMQRIERYILNRLNPEEIDELWLLFVQDPEWYEFFKTELHLRNMVKKGHC